MPFCPFGIVAFVLFRFNFLFGLNYRHIKNSRVYQQQQTQKNSKIVYDWNESENKHDCKCKCIIQSVDNFIEFVYSFGGGMNLTGSWINCNSSCVSDCVRMCRFVSISVSVSVSVRAENKYSIQFSHFYRWQHWMLQHTKTVFALSIKLCLTIQLINIINQGGMFLLSFSLAKRSKQQQQQQNYFEINFILQFAQISCNPRNSRWNFIAKSKHTIQKEKITNFTSQCQRAEKANKKQRWKGPSVYEWVCTVYVMCHLVLRDSFAH